MHPELRTMDGHVYTECVAWRRVAAAFGFEVEIFAAHDAQDAVIADTGAIRLFGETPEDRRRFVTDRASLNRDPTAWPLERFLRRSRTIARGCHSAWQDAAQKPDVVFMPWTEVFAINGVADWLADLPEAARPAMVFNLTRPDNDWTISDDRSSASGDFSWFRFSVRRLQALLAPGRFAFTAADPRLARVASAGGGMDCVLAPLHKFYPTAEELEAWRPAPAPPLSVTFPGPLRARKGRNVAAVTMIEIAARRPDARFSVLALDQETAQPLIDQGLRSTAAHFADILGADLALFPYEQRAYAAMPSGVFADAAVCGVPVVAPANTWISDRLDEGWGAGEVFASPEPGLIADAVVRAAERLPELGRRASANAAGWRRAQSLDAYVALALATVGMGA